MVRGAGAGRCWSLSREVIYVHCSCSSRYPGIVSCSLLFPLGQSFEWTGELSTCPPSPRSHHSRRHVRPSSRFLPTLQVTHRLPAFWWVVIVVIWLDYPVVGVMSPPRLLASPPTSPPRFRISRLTDHLSLYPLRLSSRMRVRVECPKDPQVCSPKFALPTPLVDRQPPCWSITSGQPDDASRGPEAVLFCFTLILFAPMFTWSRVPAPAM